MTAPDRQQRSFQAVRTRPARATAGAAATLDLPALVLWELGGPSIAAACPTAVTVRDEHAATRAAAAAPGGVLVVHVAGRPQRALAVLDGLMVATRLPVVLLGELGPEPSRFAAAAFARGAVDVLALAPPELTRALTDGSLPARLRSAARARPQPPAALPRPAAGGDDLAGLRRPQARPVRLIVLGASTGGPLAVATVLKSLRAAPLPPVLVVQHMSEGFLSGLASWMTTASGRPVAVGVDGSRLQPGTVTFAPEGSNTLVDPDLCIRLCPALPGQLHLPGVDSTLRSVAEHLGSEAVAVLMTGMGRDGADGMLALRAAGGTTLGQDEASCVVYGMPAAAAEAGALCAVLPLDRLGPALRWLTSGHRRSALRTGRSG